MYTRTPAGTRAHSRACTHTPPCQLSPDGAETDCPDLRPRSALGTEGSPANLDVLSAPHLRALVQGPGPPRSPGEPGPGSPRLGAGAPTLQPHICPRSAAPPPSPLPPALTGRQPGRILDLEASEPRTQRSRARPPLWPLTSRHQDGWPGLAKQRLGHTGRLVWNCPRCLPSQAPPQVAEKFSTRM